MSNNMKTKKDIESDIMELFKQLKIKLEVVRLDNYKTAIIHSFLEKHIELYNLNEEKAVWINLSEGLKRSIVGGVSLTHVNSIVEENIFDKMEDNQFFEYYIVLLEKLAIEIKEAAEGTITPFSLSKYISLITMFFYHRAFIQSNETEMERRAVLSVCDFTAGWGVLLSSFYEIPNMQKQFFFNLEDVNVTNLLIAKTTVFLAAKGSLYDLDLGQKIDGNPVDIIGRKFEEQKDNDFKKYDIVVTHPPFATKIQGTQKLVNDKDKERFSAKKYGGKVTDASPVGLFVQHAVSLLKEGGIAAVVMPQGVLFRNNEKFLREYFLSRESDIRLEAVVEIPQGTFIGTSIPGVILILKRSQVRNTITESDPKVTIIRTTDYTLSEKGESYFTDAALEQIKNLLLEGKPVWSKLRSVRVSEIKENDYNLNIPRYVNDFVEEVVSLEDTVTQLNDIKMKIGESSESLISQMNQLIQNNENADNSKEIKAIIKLFESRIVTENKEK